MPGPSADETVAVTKPADRWSLAVSSLLLLGLFLAAAAMVQAWLTAPPDAKPVTPPPKLKAAAPDPATQALTINLPPPPAPRPESSPASRPATPVTQPTPLSNPQPQPIAKPRVIVPLKHQAEAVRPQPRQTPAKPVKITPLKPVQRAPVTKPVLQPPKKMAAKTAAPKPAPVQKVIEAVQHRKTGGALLRLLEHGKGPSVEIAWPQSAADRQQLFKMLTRCYGMRPALLANGTRLYDATTAPGQPWAINRDRYSGFIRSPQGEPVREENRQFAAIARRHDLTGWRPVRVFPRAVDAVLLGGLGTLLGERYQSAQQIRAVYQLRRAGLRLTGFRVDGQAMGGVITLRANPGRGCD